MMVGFMELSLNLDQDVDSLFEKKKPVAPVTAAAGAGAGGQ